MRIALLSTLNSGVASAEVGYGIYYCLNINMFCSALEIKKKSELILMRRAIGSV